MPDRADEIKGSLDRGMFRAASGVMHAESIIRELLAKLDEQQREIERLKETLNIVSDKETMVKLVEAQGEELKRAQCTYCICYADILRRPQRKYTPECGCRCHDA